MEKEKIKKPRKKRATTPAVKSRRKKILSFIEKSVNEKGYPPSVREILEVFPVKSVASIHMDLKKLEESGDIEINKNISRGIKLTKKNASKSPAVDYTKVSIPVTNIPIVGEIAAGAPVLAEENITGYMPVPKEFLKDEDSFALKVRGDSMVNKGIFNGDYIMVKKQNTASNGDTVVAMILDFEAEATVKTFYDDGDYFRLQPENSYMQPIIIKNKEQLQIIGIVSGVFRFM
jgi:repressor LexA